MIGPRSFQPSNASGNRDEFDKLFVQRVHSVVAWGYKRLQPTKYAEEQETAITGYLVDSIVTVLEEASESWMRFFRVYDDPPINPLEQPSQKPHTRKGRSRRRIDIKIDSSESSSYTRFHFEAKRLGKQNPVGGYVGDDGLCLFLSGEYAANEHRAGMLGYVQQEDESVWAGRVEDKLTQDVVKFRLTDNGGWKYSQQSPDLSHTYSTCHSRSTDLGEMCIYHSLLRFH